MTQIPLVDLSLQHREVAAEIESGIARVMETGAFILGPDVTRFEGEFAEFVRVPGCVGVASGTDALELALRAAGIGPGDEVVVPVNTFVATALAAVRCGADLVLVDVDERTALIDVERAAAAVTPRTRAFVPVHLYGQVAPMEALEPIAASAGAVIVEDAAQAHGATRSGQPAGSFGVAAAFSFYPGKNLGAYGDAGAVVCRDQETAERVRRLRNYGGTQKYHHDELGTNSRLDTMQAVVLSAKLKRLARWNQERRVAATRYDALLADAAGVVLPVTAAGNEHVWHLYVVRVPQRDRVLAALQAAGVGAGIHYPIPLHLQKVFAHLGLGRGSFPIAERAAGEILSLPLYPGITEAQQARVAETLCRAVRV